MKTFVTVYTAALALLASTSLARPQVQRRTMIARASGLIGNSVSAAASSSAIPSSAPYLNATATVLACGTPPNGKAVSGKGKGGSKNSGSGSSGSGSGSGPVVSPGGSGSPNTDSGSGSSKSDIGSTVPSSVTEDEVAPSAGLDSSSHIGGSTGDDSGSGTSNSDSTTSSSSSTVSSTSEAESGNDSTHGGHGGGDGRRGGRGRGSSTGGSGSGTGTGIGSGSSDPPPFSNSTGSTGTSSTGSSNTTTFSNSALTLLASNVQTGSQSNGQAVKQAGQSPSATDPANFINFCTGKTLTNGLQVTTGSCNGVVMGDIPATPDMVSSIITFPGPGCTSGLKADSTFNFTLQVQNLVAGTFTNPDSTYYSAPQHLVGGKVVGHTHVTVQTLGDSLKTTTPPDPATFVFFKGINDAGDGKGGLSATVAGGLPSGNYRVCTMGSAANHQPLLMPVAQRGAQDDCQKFTVI